MPLMLYCDKINNIEIIVEDKVYHKFKYQYNRNIVLPYEKLYPRNRVEIVDVDNVRFYANYDGKSLTYNDFIMMYYRS